MRCSTCRKKTLAIESFIQCPECTHNDQFPYCSGSGRQNEGHDHNWVAIIIKNIIKRKDKINGY